MTDLPPPADYRTTLRLEGDLTIASAAALKVRLLDALTGPLDIDLSGVTAIDGAGVQLLAMLDRDAARREIAIAWHAPSRAVRAAFDRLRIDGPRRLWAPVAAVGDVTA